MSALLQVIERWIGTQSRIVIEPMDAGDLGGLSDIHRQSFVRGWSDGEFETLLAQECYWCLVARQAGRMSTRTVGFVLIKEIGDEAEVITIAVLPSVRRSGAGRALMDAVIRKLHADRCSTLFLEVDEGNQAAIGLYHRLGFKDVGRREGYYADPSASEGQRPSALVMQLDLD